MSEINFTIDSKFFKEINSKYDEMLIYKSNYIDFLLTQDNFEKSIVDSSANTGITNSYSYIDQVKSYAKTREDFFITCYASHTASGVDGQPWEYGFNIGEASYDSVLQDGKFKPSKFLILKFRKKLKVFVNINNMESIFLGSDNIGPDVKSVKDINTIDYAKTILKLENINKLEEIIKKSSGDKAHPKYNNKKYKVHFDNLKKNLEGEVEFGEQLKIYSSKPTKSDFSQTLGFSIKSLNYNDVKKTKLGLSSGLKITKSISITAEDLSGVPSYVSDWIGQNREWYPGSMHVPKGYFRGRLSEDTKKQIAEIKKSSNYEDGDKFKISFGGKSLYYYGMNVYYDVEGFTPEFFNSNSFYTVSYFSAFKESGDPDSQKDTYFKKSVQSNHAIEVKNVGQKFKANVIKKNSSTVYNFDIKALGDDEIKKRINKLTYRAHGSVISPTGEELTKLKKINKKINKETSDISRIVSSFKVFEDSGKIGIYVDNIIVLDNQTDYVLFEKLVQEGIIEPDNYHFFVPELFLETLTGRQILKNEIDPEDNIVIYNDKEVVLGKVYRGLYTISLENVYKNLQTTKKRSLRTLTEYYGTKWLYQKEIAYSREEITEGDRKIIYPKFFNNINFLSDQSEDKISFIGKVEIAVNGKKILATGDGDSINQESVPLADEAAEDGELKGPKEKVLKVSKSASNLEFKKLPGFFNNAKTAPGSTDVSEASTYNETKDRKTLIDSLSLEYNFAKLNGIDEKNPKGKDNTTGFKNVSYTKGIRNPYEFRRGNAQIKLITLINEAVTITQKKYPSLKSAEIMSMSSPPVDFVSSVYYSNDIYTKDKKISKDKRIEFLNNNLPEIYKKSGIKLGEEEISSIVSGFNKRGTDNNHANGLAVDVFLKRSASDGKEKYVCLYDPIDNFDFQIVKTFLTVCKGLGADGLGAGMYYMDYPAKMTHMTKKQVDKLRKSKSKTSKTLGDTIASVYEKNKIEYANEETEKIIINESGIPFRVSNSNHRNAFHIDILSDAFNFFKNNTSATYIQLDQISKSKNLSKKAKKKYAAFLKNKALFEKHRQNLSKYPSRSRVWGASSSWTTADRWLLDIINNTNRSGKVFNEVEEITKDNFEVISKNQFAEHHRSDEDTEDVKVKFVKIEDIKKK